MANQQQIDSALSKIESGDFLCGFRSMTELHKTADSPPRHTQNPSGAT